MLNVRNNLSSDAARIFMYGKILLHMSFCITCWGQAGETKGKYKTSCANKLLKCWIKKPYHFHHCRILEKCNLFSFENFTVFLICV